MLLLRLTPYDVAIIVTAWLILVVGLPVALRFAVSRTRKAWQARHRRDAKNHLLPPNPPPLL